MATFVCSVDAFCPDRNKHSTVHGLRRSTSTKATSFFHIAGRYLIWQSLNLTLIAAGVFNFVAFVALSTSLKALPV